MTINEIAKILDDCGNCRNCRECDYNMNLDCRKQMVNKMGEECRKIAEQTEDDLK